MRLLAGEVRSTQAPGDQQRGLRKVALGALGLEVEVVGFRIPGMVGGGGRLRVQGFGSLASAPEPARAEAAVGHRAARPCDFACRRAGV